MHEPVGQLVETWPGCVLALAERDQSQAGPRDQAALGTQQAAAQRLGILATLAQAFGRVDQADRQPVQALLAVGQATFKTALQLFVQAVEAGQQAGAIGADQLGGGG